MATRCVAASAATLLTPSSCTTSGRVAGGTSPFGGSLVVVAHTVNVFEVLPDVVWQLRTTPLCSNELTTEPAFRDDITPRHLGERAHAATIFGKLREKEREWLQFKAT